MGSLKVEGNKWFSTSLIEKYFNTYRGETIDMGEVEKDMMRLNGNRDLNVSSVLSPGANPETVDVTLKAQERVPYHVSVGTDNQGSRLTGWYRRLVSMNTSNLSGRDDSLSFNGAYTDLSSGYYLSYQAPVGTHGTKLGLDVGYFQGKMGEEYKSYDIRNYTESYNPNVAFELYSAQDAQVNLRSGVQIRNIYKKEGVTTITNEQLRLPYLAFDAIKIDPWGQTSFSPELSFSAPGFLGASRLGNSLSSRPGADGYCTKYSHYVSRTLYMPLESTIQIRSQFQTASRTLPTSEQFQLGGESSVRGFPAGDYLADIGGNMQTEWYFPTYPIPSSWQLYGTSMRNDIQPFVFYDMGGGRLLQSYNGEHFVRFISGAGAGVKIQIKKDIYLKMEWAVPTSGNPVRGTGPSTFDVSFQAST